MRTVKTQPKCTKFEDQPLSKFLPCGVEERCTFERSLTKEYVDAAGGSRGGQERLPAQ